jgi:His/Glu/Gln/Arg/opine family amino acid ABC transporter permease subunit
MEELVNRFYLSFIAESRWKFFVEGLGMTLLLTAVSFIAGSLLGAAFCALKLSRRSWIRKISNAFIAFLVQIPTLVLLMLSAYVLFGEASLPITVIVYQGLPHASAYIEMAETLIDRLGAAGNSNTVLHRLEGVGSDFTQEALALLYPYLAP